MAGRSGTCPRLMNWNYVTETSSRPLKTTQRALAAAATLSRRLRGTLVPIRQVTPLVPHTPQQFQGKPALQVFEQTMLKPSLQVSSRYSVTGPPPPMVVNSPGRSGLTTEVLILRGVSSSLKTTSVPSAAYCFRRSWDEDSLSWVDVSKGVRLSTFVASSQERA